MLNIKRKDIVKINYTLKTSCLIGFLTLFFNFTAHSMTNISNSTIDTIIKKDTINIKDSIIKDTLKQKSIISNDSLDRIFNYSASDSAVFEVKNRNFSLFSGSKTSYDNSSLEADHIIFYQKSNIIQAFGSSDSLGNVNNKPMFIDKDIQSLSDTILFNLKNQKGLTQNTFFQQGEVYIHAQKMKKINQNSFYASKIVFTTCNLDEPHFGFRSNKSKIINNKLGVSGPTVPEIEGVPINIGLPFLIFPILKGKQSGFTAPAFNENALAGFGLQGFSYYQPINDNIDLTLRSDIYFYGGLQFNLNSRYDKRYKMSGNFSLSYNKVVQLNNLSTSNDEFTRSTSYALQWSHRMDTRAWPGSNFSANVNFQSTNFNQSQYGNLSSILNNSISSSISYSKNWNGQYNLSIGLNHNQNNNLRQINVSFPTIAFSIPTLYPFQPKESIGSQKWYEKIGIGYSMSYNSNSYFYDSASNGFLQLVKNSSWVMSHNIPLTISLPQLGPVNISPSISYSEQWYSQGIKNSWNKIKDTLETYKTYGFNRIPQISFGLGFSTRIFGTFKFDSTKKIIAIRHQITPSFSLNYTPDVSQAYTYSTQVNKQGQRLNFNSVTGALVQNPGSNGGIGFGVDNFIEMKVKDKSDSTGIATKKIKIIDGFGFNSNYNLLADSFALGNISVYFRSTLFNKININASANLNPYKVNASGVPINKYNIDLSKLYFGRLTDANISLSTSFSSNKDDKNNKQQKQDIPLDPYLTPEEQQKQLQYIKSNSSDYVDFNTLWSINLSYSLGISNRFKTDYSGTYTMLTSNLNFNGDISVSPKWKIGANGFMDVTLLKVTQISFSVSREMHCWQLNINVTPFGVYKNINIVFSPKSGILRDLKYNRNRTYY